MNIDDLLESHTGYDLMHGFHYSKRFRALYVEVPKCACSSIKRLIQMLECAKPGEFRWLDTPSVHVKKDNPYALPGYDCFLTTQGLLAKDFLKILRSKKVYRYSFVRNPYGRVLSAYRDKVLLKKPEKIEVVDWLYPNDHDSDADKLKCEVSFEDFIDFIIHQEPCRSVNPHWRPQAMMLSYGKIKYSFIGKVESMETDWRYLFNKCYSKDFDFMPLLTRNVSRGSVSDLNAVYTEKTARLIYDYYRMDFEAFDYAKEGYLNE